MKEIKDPFTGELFIPKKSNQKFANRENQIRFNNELAKKRREEKSEINKIYNQNLKIYNRLLQDSDSVIKSREFLEGAEFNFNVFNHIFDFEGRRFFVTYNFGYSKFEDGKILLKKFPQKIF